MRAAARCAASWPELDGTAGALTIYCIYAFSADFPGAWVVRRMFVLPNGGEMMDVVPRLASGLEGARELVPPGLYRQPRSEGEDPGIVEVWF